jgi:hypothetical protein
MKQLDEGDPLQCKLDSHADTCCGSTNCLLIEFEGCMVMVAPYHDEYELMEVKIATLATLWEDPMDGQLYILIIHEALYFRDHLYILIIHEALYFRDHLKQTLLNPNQLQSHGLLVKDAPQQFDPKSLHSICIPKCSITIPLHLDGVISTFSSSKPIWEEYNTLVYPTLS